MTGGSGTPGALPFIALARARLHQSRFTARRALINPDFVRVGGAAVEGMICLDRPGRGRRSASRLGIRPRKSRSNTSDAYQKANNEPAARRVRSYTPSTAGWFSWMPPSALSLTARSRVRLNSAPPLRDAMVNAKEVVGTHGVYNFTPGQSFGVDRARAGAGQASRRQVEAAAIAAGGQSPFGFAMNSSMISGGGLT